MKREYCWLGVVLLLGLALRVAAGRYVFDLPFDSGTVALMGLHILEGERPLFMYGYNYSGALLPYLVALSFSLGGVNLVSLVIPTLLLSVGWIVATYFLLKAWFNWRAGLAGALIVAVPDWITLWFGVVPDCSYSPIFFLGTLLLLLATKLAQDNLSVQAEWCLLALLGLVAGLALWVHLLAMLYVFFAGFLLLPFLWRRRSWVLLAQCAVAAAIMGICLAPYGFAVVPTGQSTVTTLIPNMDLVSLHWQILLERGLRYLYTWPIGWPDWTRRAFEGLMVVGAIAYVMRIVFGDGWKDRCRALYPLSFVLLFLAMYLPHQQALIAAPRYLLGAWMMMWFGYGALPCSSSRRWLQGVGLGIVALLTIHNLCATVAYCQKKAPVRDSRLANYQDFLNRADEAGCDFVALYGRPYDFKALSQSLSFMARNQVRIVSYLEDRYQPAAQAADSANHLGFAAVKKDATRIASAFKAMNLSYELEQTPWVGFFHHIERPTLQRRSIPASELSVTASGGWMGHPSSLIDRLHATAFAAGSDTNAVVILDTGTVRPLCGITWLPLHVKHDLLMEDCVLSTSTDGVTFTERTRVEAAERCRYSDGGQVFLGEPYGRQETRFDPVSARFIKVQCLGGKQGMWRASEVMVFEAIATTHSATRNPTIEALDLETIQAWLQTGDVRNLVACDRRLSALLLAAGTTRVYPRYNNHHEVIGSRISTPTRRISLAEGSTWLLDTELLDDFDDVLQRCLGDSAGGVERVPLGRYTGYRVTEPLQVESLQWNGYLPVP